MQTFRKSKGKMKRGVAPRNLQGSSCNNAVVLGIATGPAKKNKQRNSQPNTVTNSNPRYLPNLRTLVITKSNITVDPFVICTLSPQEHTHDEEAAHRLRETECTVFELPSNLFPRHSPLNKITYLPSELLPAKFDAGGVFPAGVLAHKYYPTGLLKQRHSGPTPPLFVGRRIQCLNRCKNLACAAYVGIPLAQIPVSMPSQTHPKPPVHPDICVGFIIAHANSLAKLNCFADNRSQYSIYVPDLSTVAMRVHFKTPLCITVLSDILNPHEDAVAVAVSKEEAPKFELPQKYFSIQDGKIKREPVFLPERFLPPGFQAGCVFGPDTLPKNLFESLLTDAPPQVQCDVTLMPPVFIGQWKNNMTPTVFVFPNSDNTKPNEKDELELNGDIDVQDSVEPSEEKVCTEVFEEPTGAEDNLTASGSDEENARAPTPVKETAKLSENTGKSINNGGLCFFTLTGTPGEIAEAQKKLSRAGVKLASDFCDQQVIDRAHDQWLDLMKRRDEIKSKMIPTTRPRVRKQSPIQIDSVLSDCGGDRLKCGRQCGQCGVHSTSKKKE